MAIEEGKAAPAFTLKDTAGNKVALKDFKGKNVVVYFSLDRRQIVESVAA